MQEEEYGSSFGIRKRMGDCGYIRLYGGEGLKAKPYITGALLGGNFERIRWSKREVEHPIGR